MKCNHVIRNRKILRSIFKLIFIALVVLIVNCFMRIPETEDKVHSDQWVDLRESKPTFKGTDHVDVVRVESITKKSTVQNPNHIDDHIVANRSNKTNTKNRVGVDDHTNKPHSCYTIDNYEGRIDLLEDVLASNVQPQLGKSIFFHETSCHNGIVSMNARQACSVESAARANPNASIFLLFASPVGFEKDKPKNRIIEAVQSYGNVHIRNLWTYAEGTPFSEFMQTNKIFQSRFLMFHMSDLLRYMSLFKWGGTYIDMDVIVKKNLDPYKNYAAAETFRSVAAGMMHFDKDMIGQDVAMKCVEEFKKNYNGQAWGDNGPGVITRVLRRMYKTNNTLQMTRKRCSGFDVFKASTIYAVYPTKWRFFFDKNYIDYVLRVTNNSIAVHVWNKLSSTKLITVGSNTPYERLAKDYCPKVYESCGKYF